MLCVAGCGLLPGVVCCCFVRHVMVCFGFGLFWSCLAWPGLGMSDMISQLSNLFLRKASLLNLSISKSEAFFHKKRVSSIESKACELIGLSPFAL